MATATEIAALADRIAAARREKRVMDFMPGATGILSEDEAYQVQFAVHERLTAGGADRFAGWKVAVAVPALYQPIGLSGPALAGIYHSGVRHSGVNFPAGFFIKSGIECEVVARIARDAGPRAAPYDADSIREVVGALHCGMEVVENRHADLSKLDGKGRICDEFLQGACVIGPEIGNWRSIDLAKVNGTSSFAGKELACGPGANVMGGPLTSLAWLANRLLSFGKQLRAGDTVLTGSTHAPQMLSGPGRALATWEGLGSTEANFA